MLYRLPDGERGRHAKNRRQINAICRLDIRELRRNHSHCRRHLRVASLLHLQIYLFAMAHWLYSSIDLKGAAAKG